MGFVVGRLILGAEPVAVSPAVHLVADAGHVGCVRPTAAANVPHSEIEPLLDEHLNGLALVAIYPSEKQSIFYWMLKRAWKKDVDRILIVIEAYIWNQALVS